MPAQEHTKARPHPAQRPADRAAPSSVADRSRRGVAYAELSVTSNFTFLTGASHPEELVERAAELGHVAATIADRNTLAGVVRAHTAASAIGLPLAVGSRLVFQEPSATEVIVYPTDRDAYSRLSRLLTLGKRRAPKGECWLSLDDLAGHSEGLLAIARPRSAVADHAADELGALRDLFDDDRLSLAISRCFRGDDAYRMSRLREMGRRLAIPLVAVNDVVMHDAARRPLLDVLTCIRTGCTVEQAGPRLEKNAERRLKSPAEMAALFDELPEAVARSAELARRAVSFGLDQLRYEYPAEVCPEGLSPIVHLRELCDAGARSRYGAVVPGKTRELLDYELSMIEELGYEAYFLTCHDIVRFARSRGILCQGRGGAANSAVCYCLGITEVDPAPGHLLFERFISRERGEPPDIDIDFEHERREEVIQYIYGKYGRERAALTAEVISYRGRSAVREVGKAMGLPEDCVDAMARNLDRWGEAPSDERVRESGLNPADPTVRLVIELSGDLIGFPRHLSQHVGGFVITRGELRDLVPIENAAMEDRTVIEWDKDDIDAMGMLKVDCLGLGMLTCVNKAIGLLGCSDAYATYAATARDPSDPAVYTMISHADTVGVFQIESRAQMSMLPRLRPREFYDLVIEVAIVRPGPIQGGMVHPYLRRREGAEPVTYPSPEVESVLGRTLGVPLFQEQAMQLAITAAGFTPDEADGLRRSMAAWKRKGNAIHAYGQRLIEGMLANGYQSAFAERCFEQIKGFSEYGFPESHAASFAIIVYVSAWLKRYHPAAFAAALINSQPMGFYKPAQIIRDAQEHGVEVRAIDVNRSGWDCSLERRNQENQRSGDEDPGGSGCWGLGGPAIRLGMRLAKGMRADDAERIAEAVRRCGPFATVESLWRASGVGVRSLRALARADAFGSMGLDRQRALWQIRLLRDEPMPLFEQAEDTDREDGLDRLPEVSVARRVLDDYGSTGLSLKEHPVSFLRRALADRGAIEARTLRSEAACPQGRRVVVGGLVLSRQRPSTASGVVFITLEDETGIANLIVWSDTFEAYRRVARLSASLIAEGTIERQGEVVHLHVRSLESLDGLLPGLGTASRDFH